ncbi:MAG: YdcF family protein [Oligoflexia bacterium]|nr:YdcF family protein [Oligoflexia bacterium]MBF0364631.1 YdcF family protein [Oligoflexia bacterium]
MMGKQYIFETKRTRLRRYFRNFLLLILSLAMLYTVLCISIISVARYESDLAKENFYKRAPDLVAIFTGDSGRIPFGLKKSLEYQTPEILITGVYSSNSIRTLLLSQNPELLQFMNIYANQIEIDYLARNTVENVLSTLRFLRKNTSYYHTVLVISSDYHILRIKLILQFIQASNDSFDFYFMSPETDYFQWKNIKAISREVVKTLKTLGFLLLWESEYPIKDDIETETALAAPTSTPATP